MANEKDQKNIKDEELEKVTGGVKFTQKEEIGEDLFKSIKDLNKNLKLNVL